MWSVISAFPITALTAMLFRFPVPLAGYLSGIEAVIPSMIALLFYGLLFGGLVVLGALGAIGGFVIGVMIRDDQHRRSMGIRVWSISVSTVGVLTLAVLDKIIGPW